VFRQCGKSLPQGKLEVVEKARVLKTAQNSVRWGGGKALEDERNVKEERKIAIPGKWVQGITMEGSISKGKTKWLTVI